MHMPWKVLAILLMSAIVAALYWPSLSHPVFFDDIFFFNHNGLNRIFIAGPAFELRWLPYFLTAWVDLIFDDRIFAQRVINLGLHLVTGCLLYALIKQVSNHAAPHRNNERAALAAALLFLLHPLAVYAVGYLIQRTIMMATLFALLSLSTYVDGLITRKKGYFFFSALFYLLSAFSKEHALLTPAVALALTPLVAPMTRQTLKQLLLPMGLFLTIAVMVIIKSHVGAGQAYEPFADELINVSDLNVSPAMLWWLSVMTQASLFFKYIGLTVMPNPGWMAIDIRVPFAMQPWQPKYLFGLISLAAYAATALFWLLQGGRRGLVGFALLAPLLLFAIEFSVVRIQEPFVLYRAYLWIPFLFMLVPALTFAMSGRLFWSIVLILAMAFGAASIDRLGSFSNHYVLWDDAVRKLPDELAPGSARAYNNRCQQNLRKGELLAAIADCTRALQVNPKYKLAYQNRAFAYMKYGNIQAALQDAKVVAHLYPQDPHLFTLLGAIYKGAGELDAALTNFEEGCKRNSLAACVELEALKVNRK